MNCFMVIANQDVLDLGTNMAIRFSINNLIIGCTGLLGVLYSFYLLIKDKGYKRPIGFLGFFLLGLSVSLFEIYLLWTTPLDYHPMVLFSKVLFFIWAPSYYLYVQSALGKLSNRTFIHYFHYTPFIVLFLGIIFFGNYHTQNESGRILLFDMVNSLELKGIYTFLYVLFTGRTILRGKKGLDFLQSISMGGLTFFMVCITIILSARSLLVDSGNMNQLLIYVLVLLVMGCVFLIIFIHQYPFGNQDSYSGDTKEETKYKHSPLTQDMVNVIGANLLDLLKKEQVFLDHSISLEKVSELVDTNRYAVSQVINQKFGKSFYELINDHRITYATKVMKQQANRNPGPSKLKIIDLVYDSGFNNKVSFYKAFKKRKGVTPKVYLEMVFEKEEIC